jgi:hypothetical protein
MTVWELVVDSEEPCDAVEVVAVFVGSEWPSVSSLKALPPVGDAARAAALERAQTVSVSSKLSDSDAARRSIGGRRTVRTIRAYRLPWAPGERPRHRKRRAGRGARQTVEWLGMAPKQRQIRMEQRGALEAIQALEQRSDEELEAETKFKSAALAILGARASERFDAEAARGYFQRAIAAARPQERMQIRRMADASLALAERRAGDLKDAVERLGQAPPSGRQLFALRAMGLLVPSASAGILARMRGILLILILIIALLALGTGIVQLISLPFGGLSLAPSILLGLFVVLAALGVVAAIGRRRRDRARAAAPS